MKRYFGICTECKRAPVVTENRADFPLYVCPDHGLLKWQALQIHFPDAATLCDARCTGAIGPICNCSCGGINHGIAHMPMMEDAS